ncbi:hypothetical protein BDB00DRAFT_417663 [Zychaea mexicana]|uniref:uncharacterized protein n=1 Tax=Zychaea mexicana TaxID=64656 RepID=UPI0022FEF807|nr:uncharacterized protein BDB00DRAFT_417663 [Zychaea mexicana]KAI9492799.1 hypothetical protein BDB00DRAFT_417663 [Zychaea mexicana]
MVNDAILTAEFVQSLPVFISKSLGVSADDVIVVSITTAGSNSSDQKSSSKKKRDEEQLDESSSNSGILVSMAIPSGSVETLQNLVATPSSDLYDASNGQLATLIDTNYFVASTTNNNSDGSNDTNGGNNGATSESEQSADPSDPNQVSNQESGESQGPSSSGGLSTGAIVGIAVSCGVVLYAVGTVLFVRRYRKRRQQRQEEEAAQHQVFAQSISAPIMQENSLGWSSSPPPLQQFPHHAHSQW